MRRCSCGFAPVVENSKDVVLRLARDSRHLYANAAIAVMGVEAADAVGKTWAKMGFSREICQLWTSNLQAVFASGTERLFETGFVTSKGDAVYFSVQLLPEFDICGEVVSALWIARDVSNERKLEQEMARLARLNLVGQTAAAIGHEIRNPMTTVRGLLQLLNEKETGEKNKEYYMIMLEELDRANAIISEYLGLAKKKPTLLSEGNINDIIRSLYPLMQATAVEGNKQLDLILGDIGQIMLDQDEIRQVILNLVKNALEATPEKGHVTIKTGEDDGQAIVMIEDQGTGIAPHLLDKLGTPFFTTKEKGVGLGLAVCYSIAKRHKAKIEVRSSDHGTSFSLRFPCLR